MSRKKNLTILALNTVIVSLVVLNKSYKPTIESLAKEYRKKKAEKSLGKNLFIKKEMEEIIEKAKDVMGDVGNIVADAFTSVPLHEINSSSMMSSKVQSCICQQLEKVREENMISFAPKPALSMVGGASIAITNSYSNQVALMPSISSQAFKQLCSTLALIVALNSWGASNLIEESRSIEEAIIEDIEEFFSDFTIENHLEESKPLVLEATLPIAQQIEKTMNLPSTYTEKFDQILSIDGISLDYAIFTIMHSDMTSNANVFAYILSILKMLLMKNFIIL